MLKTGFGGGLWRGGRTGQQPQESEYSREGREGGAGEQRETFKQENFQPVSQQTSSVSWAGSNVV